MKKMILAACLTAALLAMPVGVSAHSHRSVSTQCNESSVCMVNGVCDGSCTGTGSCVGFDGCNSRCNGTAACVEHGSCLGGHTENHHGGRHHSGGHHGAC